MRLRPLQTPFRVSLGDRGEMIAWEFLLKKGYKILEKNYRCKIGEADVIARKDGRLIFIEVKTRMSARYGPPEEAVHKTKQRKITQIAEWYRKEKKLLEDPVSFEVVAVDWSGGKEPRVKHICDAFTLDGFE